MGTLYLVATPIGNLEDLSPRALRALREARLIAAEDTRRTRALLRHFGFEAREMISYFEHSKLQKIDYILARLGEGDVALVSDAGMPAINDPGFELARAALEAGFEVRPIPGPSAPVTALAASGLPTDRFVYLGYLPHKAGERRKEIGQAASLPYTLIWLETPHRLVDALGDLLAELGDRQVCVAREMTKLFEEFYRGSLSGALAHFQSQPPRGELTLVLAGAQKKAALWTEAQILDSIRAGLKQGEAPSRLSKRLAHESGWSKRDLYRLIEEHKP